MSGDYPLPEGYADDREPEDDPYARIGGCLLWGGVIVVVIALAALAMWLFLASPR